MFPYASPLLFGGSGTGTTDPNFSSVVFLAGFDAVTLADESTYNHTPTNSGGTGTALTGVGDTTDPIKFGARSYRQQNGNGSTKYPSGTEWPVGSSLFTLETWVYFTTAPTTGSHHILGKWDTGTSQGSFALSYFNGAPTLFRTANGSTQSNVTGTHTPTINTWYHFAADFDGTKYRLYVDGVMVGSSTTAVNLFSSTAPFTIGCILTSSNANTSFRGFLDEIRITKGVARYASDGGSTVPTAAYPRS